MDTQETLKIDLGAVEVWKGNDDITRAVHISGHIFDEECCRKTLDAFKRLNNDNPCYLIVDLTHVGQVTRGARELAETDFAKSAIAAFTMIVGNPISRVISRLFIGINKPPYPIKVFSSEAPAIDWLNSIRRREKQ